VSKAAIRIVGYKAARGRGENSMGLIPIPENPQQLAIVWQNSVIDVEATSRYEPNKKDTANVSTTFLLQTEYQGEVGFIVPGHFETEVVARDITDPSADASTIAEAPAVEHVGAGEAAFGELQGVLERLQADLQVQRDVLDATLDKVKQFHRFRLELSPGRRLVRFFTRLPLIEEPDGSYKFSEIVPAAFTQMITHGDFSVVGLLPRRAQGYDAPNPTYGVQLVEWSQEVTWQVFGHESNPAGPALTDRLAVTWYWRNDPLLFFRYRYI
jgi:hypothetical protein